LFSTVSAGAIVAPPMTRAAPSDSGVGMNASTAKLAANADSSHANCRVNAIAGRRVPNQMPPIALPTPQMPSSTPPRPSPPPWYPA
jgi:hypothetical protein